MKLILGLLLPFIGTSIGSSFVYFIKKDFNKNFNKIIIGFSIGIMLSSSIFSLLLPSIELSDNFILPSIGFILGFILLFMINKISNNEMFALSIIIHNIPEGMAVGVSFAGVLTNTISINSAFMLSFAIALQNIPEGSIISIPYRLKGNAKNKSFLYGVFSGVVEPIFSCFTLLLTNITVPLLPLFLSFASGCMIYVIFDELVLEIHKDNKPFLGLLGILLGFIIMMALDISF